MLTVCRFFYELLERLALSSSTIIVWGREYSSAKVLKMRRQLESLFGAQSSLKLNVASGLRACSTGKRMSEEL